MTVLDAVLKAVSENWSTERDIQNAVALFAGKYISGSNATARVRQLRTKGHKVEARHLHENRWEYRASR